MNIQEAMVLFAISLIILLVNFWIVTERHFSEMIIIEYYKKGQIFNVDKILKGNNIKSVVKSIKTKARIIKADEVYVSSSDGSNRRLRLKLYTLFIHNFMYDTRRTVKKVNKLYLKTYLQNGKENIYI